MIFDVTSQNFQELVIEKSKKHPVLVDFWAEWCGPCKALTPVLEKIVESMNGKITLAKVNTEEAPDLAQSFGIRGIPNVKLFVNGSVKSEFQGNLPEDQIRNFIEQFSPNPTLQSLKLANQCLEDGAYAEAIEHYKNVLEAAPNHEDANFGMTRALFRSGELEKAKQYLENANPQNVQVQNLKELIEIVRSPEAVSLESSSEPAASAYGRGINLLSKGQINEALDLMIESIQSDRNFQEEAARKIMVGVFEELGPKHPMTLAYQKKLARSLY